MIHFYYHPTPNPAKVALFLEETGLPYAINRYRREAERLACWTRTSKVGLSPYAALLYGRRHFGVGLDRPHKLRAPRQR